MQVNQTPKFIKITAILVVMFIIYMIAHAHYQILLRVDPVKFIGESSNIAKISHSEIVRLYKTYSWQEQLQAIIMALGLSLSTIIIIIYYKHILIKLLFVALDGATIYLYLGKNYDYWWFNGSYIYSGLTVLIIFFIGTMVSDFIREYTEAPVIDTKIPDKQQIVNETLHNQMQTLQSDIDNLQKFFTAKTQIEDIDRQINAKKQQHYRKNTEWRDDKEIQDLIEDKNNLTK